MSEAQCWTRLEIAAKRRGMTIQRFAQLSDEEILREPNIGKFSVKVLRRKYPEKLDLEMPREALCDQLDYILKVLTELEKLLKQREN